MQRANTFAEIRPPHVKGEERLVDRAGARHFQRCRALLQHFDHLQIASYIGVTVIR